ncbi:sensor histidine kinase [Roseovarius dicentrarchi]|uniref:sensor histidine kinase n=1 Tax=Roseovarius dicentrarchi TaxID=2250573 RepID=UPI00139669D1|nr:histidine kinase dimerization/phosphoacceptor domain -containing protein [Roseovarius dicentrarchi]
MRPERAAIPEQGWQSLRRRNALLPRVALLLTLALLPLGIIAVAQTQRAVDAARDTYRASLSAQTSRLAQPEREAIQSAHGITRGLADALVVLGPTDAVCADLMRYSSSRNDQVVFLGFVDSERRSQCNNFGKSYDFSEIESLQSAMQRGTFTISFNESGGASGKPVVIVQQPVFNEQGVFKGLVNLSVLTEDLVAQRRADRMSEDAVLVTFNHTGQVLTSDRPADQMDAFLPAETSLIDLVGGGKQLFTEKTRSGALREFAVVPIIEGKAYALGSWNPARPLVRDRAFATLTLLFPLLMWLISLVVALVAIRLQVIRPVRILGRQMRDFAEGRRVFRSDALDTAPSELREIGETFSIMAQKVIRDEADLENTVHERDVLIKEVHHRVKNNLQLMSSILSMQARTAPTQDTRNALRKVQDRLTSLAAVHRGLYETPMVSQVRVDTLLNDLLRQLTTLGGGVSEPLDVNVDLEQVVLVPDQAGPLAMLAAEGFTNALKYGSVGVDGRRAIRVTLRPDPDMTDMVMFEIANTVSPGVRTETDQGLGLKLIQAFCAQLDGRLLSNHEEGGWYTMSVRFKVQAFEPDQHTPRV